MADDVQVSCVFPCLDFLADKLGYNGSNIQERMRIQTVIDGLKDMQLNWFLGPGGKPKQDSLSEADFMSFARFLAPIEMEMKMNNLEFMGAFLFILVDLCGFEFGTKKRAHFTTKGHQRNL